MYGFTANADSMKPFPTYAALSDNCCMTCGQTIGVE